MEKMQIAETALSRSQQVRLSLFGLGIGVALLAACVLGALLIRLAVFGA